MLDIQQWNLEIFTEYGVRYGVENEKLGKAKPSSIVACQQGRFCDSPTFTILSQTIKLSSVPT